MKSELVPTDKSGRSGPQASKGTAVYFLDSMSEILYRLQGNEMLLVERGGFYPESLNFNGQFRKKKSHKHPQMDQAFVLEAARQIDRFTSQLWMKRPCWDWCVEDLSRLSQSLKKYHVFLPSS